MGLISLLKSWGSSVADGASRAVASFESRLEKSRELNRRYPRDRGIGDRFFSSTMRGAGAYGFPGNWAQNRQVQVGEFRRWVHVAIDSICSETEGVNWQVGFVHAEDPAKGKSATRRKRLPQNKGLKRFHGKALAKKKLRDWRYNKSHHAIKPHEKVTPAGPDHPLVKLLTKPNVWDDGGQLFYELVLFLKLTGNAYLWVVPNQLNGLPCELWVIPSHWVFPHVGAGGIDYYEVRPLYGTGGGTLRIPEDEIIHFSCKNPLHKIDGFAPLQAGAEWVDVAQSIDTSRYWQFKSGCFAVGAIELGEKYDPDDQQIDGILAKFYARYQGETNTGKPIVMPPDAKYVPLTIAPQEMAYHDSAEQMRDWILALFRVPKEIAGIQDAGSEHAIYGPLLSFRIKAIIPLVRRIGNVLTRHLASRWDDHLRVWGEVPTTEDPAGVRAFAKQNLELGTSTINEYRAELGMEALDDPLADEVLVDPKRIPLSMLAKQLEQQQQQAQMMQAMGGQPGQPGQPGQKPPQPGADGQKKPEEPGGQAPDVSALGKQFLDGGRRKASFFSECDRDEGGHCKPGSGGGNGGEEPAGGGKPRRASIVEQEERAREETSVFSERLAHAPIQRYAFDALAGIYVAASGVTSARDMMVLLTSNSVGRTIRRDVRDKVSQSLKPVAEGLPEKFGKSAEDVASTVRDAGRLVADGLSSTVTDSLRQAAKAVKKEGGARREVLDALREGLGALANPDASKDAFIDVFSTTPYDSDIADQLADDLADWPVNEWKLVGEGETDLAAAHGRLRGAGVDIAPEPDDDWYSYAERVNESLLEKRQAAARKVWSACARALLPEKAEGGDSAKSLPVARVKSLGGGGGPEYDLLHDFPDVRQPNRYACGAAASMAVGLWYGVGPESIGEWEKALGTTVEKSTHPTAIIEYFKSLGLQVEARDGMTVDDLAGYTRRGIPVICCVQDWGAEREPGASFLYGHYLTTLCVSNGMVMCQDSSLENAEYEPGGDVPPSEAEASGNIAAPGRVMVPVETWDEVWHDSDLEGRKFIHFGIAVGPPANSSGIK